MKPEESLAKKVTVAGSIPRVDVAFSIFNFAIMFVFVLFTLTIVHLPIRSFLCGIIIAIVAVLHDWLLIWTFHFRLEGLVPIFKKNLSQLQLLHEKK